jgi:hypothetical protein
MTTKGVQVIEAFYASPLHASIAMRVHSPTPLHRRWWSASRGVEAAAARAARDDADDVLSRRRRGVEEVTEWVHAGAPGRRPAVLLEQGLQAAGRSLSSVPGRASPSTPLWKSSDRRLLGVSPSSLKTRVTGCMESYVLQRATLAFRARVLGMVRRDVTAENLERVDLESAKWGGNRPKP